MFTTIKGKIVETDEGFSVDLVTRGDIEYVQGEKRLLVDCELLTGQTFLVVYAVSIKRWESGEPIDEDTKKLIVDNIRRAFAWEGLKIDIDW